MKKRAAVVSNIISWMVMIALFLGLLVTVFNVVESKRTGEDVYFLDHRPIVVLTGSMEPTMRENSIIISEKVESIDELHVGDIITYHVEVDNEIIRVTHRITSISEDGLIRTKGDNNSVGDAYPITIDNVQDRTVFIMNWVATLVEKWQSGTAGKIQIIAPVVLFILVAWYFSNLKAIKAEEEAERRSQQLDAVLDVLATNGLNSANEKDKLDEKEGENNDVKEE